MATRKAKAARRSRRRRPSRRQDRGRAEDEGGTKAAADDEGRGDPGDGRSRDEPGRRLGAGDATREPAAKARRAQAARPRRPRRRRRASAGGGARRARSGRRPARRSARRCPLEALGAFEPADDGRDPVAILQAQEKDRLQFLLPVRHARMLQNAFGFYRGAPAVMAADLGAGLRTTLDVQLCGDAHLLNFGIYGSPERSLVFDVNDFDETLPGPVRVGRQAADRQPGGGRAPERHQPQEGARHRPGRRALLPDVHAPVRRDGHPDDLVHAARRGPDPRRHPRPRPARRRGQDGGQGDQPRQRPGGGQAQHRRGRRAQDHQPAAAHHLAQRRPDRAAAPATSSGRRR